jgi:hypothetical protein
VVTGQLLKGGYTTVDNPVVIAESSEGATYLSHVHADLTFRVTVPVGSTYRLSLANSTRAGSYVIISHLNWDDDVDGMTAFAQLDDAREVALGVVQPVDWTAVASGSTGAQGASTLTAQSAKPDDVGDQGQPASSGKPAVAPDDDDGRPDQIGACTSAGVGESKSSNKIHSAKQGVGQQDQALGGGVDKVTICHIPPGNPANAHTITVGAPAVPAHLAHGDHLGACLPTEKSPDMPGGCDTPDGPSAMNPAAPELPPGGSSGGNPDGPGGGTANPPSGTSGTPGAPGGTSGTPGGTPGAPSGTSGTPGGTPGEGVTINRGYDVPAFQCVVNADCATGQVCLDYACLSSTVL